MSNSEKESSLKFWKGTIVGFAFAILSSLVTVWFQYSFSMREKEVQLYLDEKKYFVDACNEYLKQYRDWHALMSFYIYKGMPDSIHISEFDSISAKDAYKKWVRDFDLAYGKLLLVSDNELGSKTLEVSTIMHSALKDLISKDIDRVERQKLLEETNLCFFQGWLLPAQKEIFRYNTGKRKQKSIDEYIQEHKEQLVEEEVLMDSANAKMKQSLLDMEDK